MSFWKLKIQILILIPIIGILISILMMHGGCTHAHDPAVDLSKTVHFEVTYYPPNTSQPVLVWKAVKRPHIFRGGDVSFKSQTGGDVQLMGSYTVVEVFPSRKLAPGLEKGEGP